jgi:hypothetical protein
MLFQKLGRKMLHHRVLAAIFDLAGSATAPSVQIVGDRDAMWWEYFRSIPYHQRRKLGVVHSHSGRRVAWEDLLVKYIGIDWEAKLQKISALDRINKKRDFIDAACAGLGLPALPRKSKAGDPRCVFPPKAHHDLTIECVVSLEPTMLEHDSAWLRSRRQFEIASDCQSLCNLVNGEMHCVHESHLQGLKSILTDLHTIVVGGWWPRAAVLNPVVWRPRSQNKQADAACNLAMNERDDFRWANPNGATLLSKVVALQIFTDGGVRTNDTASGAYCLHAWVEEEGATLRRHLLFVHAIFINAPMTPFGAELTAMRTAAQHLRDLVSV